MRANYRLLVIFEDGSYDTFAKIETDNYTDLVTLIKPSFDSNDRVVSASAIKSIQIVKD